jgi:hypothetical protein
VDDCVRISWRSGPSEVPKAGSASAALEVSARQPSLQIEFLDVPADNRSVAVSTLFSVEMTLSSVYPLFLSPRRLTLATASNPDSPAQGSTSDEQSSFLYSIHHFHSPSPLQDRNRHPHSHLLMRRIDHELVLYLWVMLVSCRIYVRMEW